MISGVAMVLFGEAALMRSAPHAIWALTFAAINLVYIPLFEEPQLVDGSVNRIGNTAGTCRACSRARHRGRRRSKDCT